MIFDIWENWNRLIIIIKLEMQKQMTNLQADNKLAKEYNGDMDSKFKRTKNKLILTGKEKGTGHSPKPQNP